MDYISKKEKIRKRYKKSNYIHFEKKKTICDSCAWHYQCNRMDKTRGMACKDFEVKKV